MGNMCITDDRSQRLAKRRERERLVKGKYSAYQESPDHRHQLSNGGLESGFANADKCHRCHLTFNVVRRRHHCRRCKQSFCGSHSNRKKNAFTVLQEKGESDPSIPSPAVAPMVRVCEGCFLRLARKSDGESSY